LNLANLGSDLTGNFCTSRIKRLKTEENRNDIQGGRFPTIVSWKSWVAVANFSWGALARLGLARAYKLQGDTAKARAAYQDFLTLWKDADADIPILKQAKAEYAKLH